MMEPRHWEEEHIPESNRCEQLKRVFIVCQILQSNEGWWKITEVHTAYIERVGQISCRTIKRDLLLLAAVGIVEHEKHSRESARPVREFRWLGWPTALH